MRRLITVFAWVLLLGALAPAAHAHDDHGSTPEGVSTPEGFSTGVELPTLDITVTATGYEGIPATLEAGRYVVNLTVAEEAREMGGGVAFVQPDGMTGEEFIGFLGQLAGGGDAPAAEGEAGGMMLPEFIFTSTFAGGVFAEDGQSAWIILDLTPGSWVAWGDDPTAPWAPVAFEVTGEMPADLPEPESGATITMGEYVIEVTEGELVSGRQLVRIDNIGAQPHFVEGLSTTKAITEADLEAILAADMTGTPAAVDFNPETDFTNAFFSGTQSTNTSVWIPMDLEAGNLAMLCFFPDVADGAPHAFHGMYSLVAIAE